MQHLDAVSVGASGRHHHQPQEHKRTQHSRISDIPDLDGLVTTRADD